MSIDQRRWKRFPVNIEANIHSGAGNYEGRITNMSAGGVGYLITSVHIDAGDFAPEKIVVLQFRFSPNEQLDLQCEVRWFSWDSVTGDALIGMRVLNSSPAYQAFTMALGEAKEHAEPVPAGV